MKVKCISSFYILNKGVFDKDDIIELDKELAEKFEASEEDIVIAMDSSQSLISIYEKTVDISMREYQLFFYFKLN